MHKYQHSNMRNMGCGGEQDTKLFLKLLTLKKWFTTESQSDEVSENSQ